MTTLQQQSKAVARTIDFILLEKEVARAEKGRRETAFQNGKSPIFSDRAFSN
jgi:hypothetical protein